MSTFLTCSLDGQIGYREFIFVVEVSSLLLLCIFVNTIKLYSVGFSAYEMLAYKDLYLRWSFSLFAKRMGHLKW